MIENHSGSLVRDFQGDGVSTDVEETTGEFGLDTGASDDIARQLASIGFAPMHQSPSRGWTCIGRKVWGFFEISHNIVYICFIRRFQGAGCDDQNDFGPKIRRLGKMAWDNFDKLECDRCGKWVPEDQISSVQKDGSLVDYCPACTQAAAVECAECGELVDRSEATLKDGQYYCRECLATMVECAQCGELIDRSEATLKDGHYYCDDCLEENTFSDCEICHRHLPAGKCDTKSYENVQKCVCEDCQNHYETCCEICGKPILRKRCQSWGDYFFCQKCTSDFLNLFDYCKDHAQLPAVANILQSENYIEFLILMLRHPEEETYIIGRERYGHYEDYDDEDPEDDGFLVRYYLKGISYPFTRYGEPGDAL